jgi:oligoribonuclease
MSASRQAKGSLIWLDLEMTGLDSERHTILEIGTIITDSALKVLAEGPAIAIHQPEAVLKNMDSWCVEHHGKSGLTEACRTSRFSMAQAETRTLQFLKKHLKPDASPLCGNSIGQDRRFLIKYMPKLNAFFHYRNVDVSSIKELVHRWYPRSAYAPEKKKSHLVLDDIRESIDELKHYRRTVFK